MYGTYIYIYLYMQHTHRIRNATKYSAIPISNFARLQIHKYIHPPHSCLSFIYSFHSIPFLLPKVWLQDCCIMIIGILNWGEGGVGRQCIR